MILLDEILVYDYNGVSGDDFQVFYLEQAPDFIVPQSANRFIGSPEAGLTNQQNWDTYGIAISGAVAPCATIDGDNCEAAAARATAKSIQGLVFPLTESVDSFPAIHVPPVIRVTPAGSHSVRLGETLILEVTATDTDSSVITLVADNLADFVGAMFARLSASGG